jgi:hypothetical protein
VMMVSLWAIVAARQFVGLSADAGDAYGLISALQTECEMEALTVGSRLSDAFNSYDETVGLIGRTQHRFFQRQPFFFRLLHHGLEQQRKAAGHHNSGLKPQHEERLHKNSTINSGAFGHLADKWVYFLGDRSLFPVVQTLLSPFHAADVDSEQWKQQHCTNSKTSSNYTSTPTLPGEWCFCCLFFMVQLSGSLDSFIERLVD